MQAASSEQRYERAAGLRDQLLAIKRIVEKQQVISPKDVDVDVIAFAHEANDACVQVFFIRSGKLIGREYFVLEGTADEDNDRILTAFVKHFYHKATFVPQEVLLPGALAEAQIIKEWLRDRRGGRKVALTVPRRGAKRNLVRMAAENASEILSAMRTQWQSDTLKQEAAIAELQELLGLPKPPNRIECFDISNTQGTAATGGMAVFHQGTPEKSHYRCFNIRTVAGPDDYACMREILMRRFGRWQQSREQHAAGTKRNEAFTRLPDLLLVDGGKGQLGVAQDVLRQFELSGAIAVAALAKPNEDLFVPGQIRPVVWPKRSPALFLAQRIRDEAHRFALSHHRQRRSKSGMASQLDNVPGIGPARRKALLRHFGSVERIRAASLAELLEAEKMTRRAAQSIKELL
jgi:excinuclease ABC subunit C